MDEAKDRLHGQGVDQSETHRLLDVLAQGERTVDALSRETRLTINTTSSHLPALKALAVKVGQ